MQPGHVGDVGHTLVVGPTGAGKSVLLALMALQFRRYDRSQVFAFDFGGSIRAAALAMGGDWHDLGGGLTDGSDASVSLQPLARIHDSYERAWAADWIVAILMRVPAPLHRDLAAYADILARETGQSAADPIKLIVPMLERFIATDRGFAKARRHPA